MNRIGMHCRLMEKILHFVQNDMDGIALHCTAMIAKRARRATLSKDVVQQIRGQGSGVGDRGQGLGMTQPWSQRSS
jgi:hypothetical protein